MPVILGHCFLGGIYSCFTCLCTLLIIVVFCHSYCDIEYKNNSLKQLFSLPVNRNVIFFSKITFLIGTVLLSVLIAYFLFMLSGYIMSYTLGLYSFQNYDNRIIIAAFFFKMLIASLSIAFIQLFLSLIIKNFTIPVRFACFGVIFSLVSSRWEYINFVPST